MITLQQVATGVASRLQQIPNLYAYDHPVAQPNLPAAMFVVPPIDYRQAMGAGVIQIPAEIHLLGSMAAGHQAQQKLWPYLDWAGPKSILAAIDADKTLGISSLVDCNVMRTRALQLEEIALEQAFGAAIELLILITNRE